MTNHQADERKIFNDPVYGLIVIPNDLVFSLIEHPYFQRLRRIKQLGLTHLVYPGALHTRFQHSIGAMHLMSETIESLRSKGLDISAIEAESVLASILLHDIGHGPFSHALENSIIHGVDHEAISLAYMESLNAQMNGRLEMCIDIFRDRCQKKYLSRLVSGQLDMDRLDYLKRDSFFCGVVEGIISDDRIIKTMNVTDNQLVIESKGIYSVEKFIIARRLMYWQVYLHKTVIAAESLLIRVLRRAKHLSEQGMKLFGTPSFLFFMENDIDRDTFREKEVLGHFSRIDDFDILTAIKVWTESDDRILSRLSSALVNRELFRIEMQNDPFDPAYVEMIRKKAKNTLALNEEDLEYYVFEDETSSYSYDLLHTRINVLLKSGKVIDFTEAAGEFNLTVLTEPVTKYILGYPKNI